MRTKLIVVGLLCVLIGGFSAENLPTANAQDPVEITFMHIYADERDTRRDTIESIAEAFMEQNPNIVVNLEPITGNYGDVFEGALRAASQGNAPHVIQLEDTLVQIAIDSQMFVKMSDYATEEHKASLPDIIEPMRNFYDITPNEFWGVPWNASNPVMYFNPDMFVAAGLDPESPPQTFAEIMAACEAIMAADIPDLEGCINWPVKSWFPEQWVAMQNALMVNHDNGRTARPTEALIDSPEMLNVFRWWQDLADRGFFTYTGTPDDFVGEGLLFVSKKTAIHLSSSAGIAGVFVAAPLMGQFTPVIARFPLPSENANNGITPGGAALWILAGHPDAETRAAAEFVFFLINTENVNLWHKASGYFPIRTSSVLQLEDEGWFDGNPFFRIPLDQLLDSAPNSANAGMRIGAYTQVREAVIQAALAVIDQGADPSSALTAAKSRADKAIHEYNDVIGN